MDWRRPNASVLFQEEGKSEIKRYTRAVKNPPLYGICTRDYERDHRVSQWPSGTEYQFAYCSNYRTLLPPFDEPEPKPATLLKSSPENGQPEISSLHKLYPTTPLPIVDKHYRGAVYHCKDPVGISVPEELSPYRKEAEGIQKTLANEHCDNEYTPNYRYKEWIAQKALDIHKEIESKVLFCRLPEIDCQHYKFYNEVRMKRQREYPERTFAPCRVIPIPLAKDIPYLPCGS